MSSGRAKSASNAAPRTRVVTILPDESEGSHARANSTIANAAGSSVVAQATPAQSYSSHTSAVTSKNASATYSATPSSQPSRSASVHSSAVPSPRNTNPAASVVQHRASATIEAVPRSAQAEIIFQSNLSAEAARALAAARKPESKTALAIASAGTAAARRIAAPTKPVWSTVVSADDLQTRINVHVPLKRIMTFPHFMGLFGELARSPEGILAMYLSALWLYAQAVPPTGRAEHVTSVLQESTIVNTTVELAPDAVLSVGTEMIGKKVVGSHGPELRRRGNVAAAALPAPAPGRGAIIGSHFAATTSGTHSGPSIPRLRNELGYFGSSGPPQDLALVADQILLFLMDDLLTETRDNSPKRYFRASDRAMLEHYLRGHPDMITRFGNDSMEGADSDRKAQKRLEKDKRKEARHAKRAHRNDADDDDKTYGVSLKDSDDSSSSDSDSDSSGSDVADSLSFQVEENLFSLDSAIVVNPQGGESRFTTRYVSFDGFHSNLLPVKMRQDRAGVWRIYDFYSLFYGSALERPPPIEIPTTAPPLELAPFAAAMQAENAAAAAAAAAALLKMAPPQPPVVDTPVYEKPRASIFALMASGVPTPANGGRGTSTQPSPVDSRRPSTIIPGSSVVHTPIDTGTPSTTFPIIITVAPTEQQPGK